MCFECLIMCYSAILQLFNAFIIYQSRGFELWPVLFFCQMFCFHFQVSMFLRAMIRSAYLRKYLY